MKLTVLSTSDTHGYLYPTNFRKRNQSLNFGLTKLVSEMRKIEKEKDIILLKIDNGDFLQGSPLSFYLEKNREAGSMADIMNQIGYDCGVLGNHEFNYGLQFLEETIAKLNYPIVCANILKCSGEYFTGTPYTIFEKEGVKIAVLGLTTQYIPHWEKPEIIEGLIFKSAVETAKEFVPKLREIADVVIVSYHGGFEKDLETGEATEVITGENEGYALLYEVEGIDVLLTGHQHRYIALNNEKISATQPGDKGKFIARVDVDYEEDLKKIIKTHAELIKIGKQEEDFELRNRYLPLSNQVEDWLDETLGKVEGNMKIEDTMEARMYGHPYIEFIQEVQKNATGANISSTALFDDKAKGFSKEISRRDIMTNYIYPSSLSVVSISGEDLRLAIEKSACYFDENTLNGRYSENDFSKDTIANFNYDLYSGIDYTIDTSRPKGDRVTYLSYNEKKVLPQDRLEVVMSQYRAVGGGDYSMFNSEKIIKEISVDMVELITEYLKNHPKIKAIQPTNFKLIK
ncbi:MAG: bifunctional UDP-sugar hydrolase/5'-nucleotidase [Vagococcus sp.]|uniref:bifunctional metallophosphatase/5'-nucleotidase n=1 Tax=Vagococcus sp. TaxID=1933889 RepID=UPI002FC5ED06